MRVRFLVLATSLFLSTLVAGPVLAQPTQNARAQSAPVSNEATQVVEGFMAAMSNGQLEAARQYLAPEAVVIANGQVLGTRDGYIDGAAKGDAAAMKSVRSRELLRRASQLGAQIGWVVSEKRMVGEGAGEMRAMLLTETMLLAKTPSGWKITHIHWSSRAAG